jgi:hypothetical protein
MTPTRAAKASIVFCHGRWADGSCFSKVIPTLQADGHEVIAAQYGRATTPAVDSGHAPMLSHPDLVIDVIRAAAKAVQGSTAAAAKTAADARSAPVPA